jgi:hypothetical protein
MSRGWAVRGPLSRFGDALQKPPFPTLALAVIVITLLITMSLVLDKDSAINELRFITWSHGKITISFLLVFLAGGASGLLVFGMAQSGWKESASCFWVSVKQTGILLGIIGFALLAFLIWIASAWISSDTKQHYLNQHDPGGIFAAFMGIVTIVGFAFTLHDLREMRRRITTFPDLIERLTMMLKRAKGEEVVRFLAYTPALGYIALEDNEFNDFYLALQRTADSKGRRPVDMICLSHKDLVDWHDLFIGRKTRRKKFADAPAGDGGATQKPARPGIVDPNLAAAATKMSEYIVDLVEAKTPTSNEPRIKCLPFDFLPGYYFFVSSDRAIVVAPLQLPFPKGAPKAEQQSRGAVQMLGFETNDRAIIHDLKGLHESFKELPSSYIAEYSSAPVAARDFEDWCKDPGHCRTAMEALLAEYAVAKGPLANGATEEEKRRHQDYGKYLTEDKLGKTTLEVIFRVLLKEEAPESTP